LFIIAVAAGISGTSTGFYWRSFGDPGVHDPSLLVGVPRGVRSDEWLVQSSWVVSQSQQGFAPLNETFPGGMDATVQNDLPSWDWSTIFRPHVAGLLFLPLDQGMAIRWWVPALALLAGCYVFVVSLLPRRPITAVALSLCMFFTPLIQWWFVPTTLWPVALAFLGATAVVWAIKDPRLWVRVVWAGLAAYVAVATAMSIYAPFIVPAALVLLFFSVGYVLDAVRGGRISFGASLKRLVPLFSAFAAAAVVLVVWILTRLSTIAALFTTVYPGQRLEATGASWGQDILGLVAGPLDGLLWWGNNPALGGNQSESSSVLLICVFLLPIMVWLIVQRWRTEKRLDWTMTMVVACIAVVTAFLFIPGWDAVAHLLLLDRSTDSRMRLAYAILAIVSVVLVIARLDASERRAPWLASIVTTGFTALAIAGVAFAAYQRDPALVLAHRTWIAVAIAILAGIFLLTRKRATLGSGALLIASLGVGLLVNPLYVGVFDLNETAVGKSVAATNASAPGTWVGIGQAIPTAVLVESGVRALNGVQTYPPAQMWDAIDPAHRYETEWNRLANVNWAAGQGEPSVSNPVRDQILATFDSCSAFAASNVKYVLAERPIPQACLTLLHEVRQGQSQFWVYRVTQR
jgi:hypothetical protein